MKKKKKEQWKYEPYILLVVHAKEFGIGLPRRAAKYFTLDLILAVF